MPRIIPVISACLKNGTPGLQALLMAVTDKEYEDFMNGDPINENQISLTFVKQYLADKGYTSEIAEEKLSKAFAGKHFVWSEAYTISIPNLKEVLEIITEGGISHFDFINAYCEYLKGL